MIVPIYYGKNVPNHQPVGVNPHDIPIFQWFLHGFPMIYGDLWWLPSKTQGLTTGRPKNPQLPGA